MIKRVFHFVKSNNLSGLENVVINICTLVNGYDYTYVSRHGPIDAILNYYGIKHITISKLTPLNILKVIKKYNPDIVQAHDERVTAFMAPSYFYCHTHGIKMLSELHNNDPKTTKWWQFRSIAYFISSLFYNKIISVSQDILNNYAYSNFIKYKTKVIPNIVNPYRIKESLLSDVSKKWDCMFLGRIVYQKDPLRFVRIIKELQEISTRNIKAVVVGDGALLPKMKRLVKQYNLSNNIDFVGFQADPYKYLQQSKTLVITSKFEGFCLVALESIMIGTPVVSTSLDILKELIGRKAGNFAKNDNEFVCKIFNLINRRSLYNYKKNIGLKRIMSVNNVNQFIKNYKLIYEE